MQNSITIRVEINSSAQVEKWNLMLNGLTWCIPFFDVSHRSSCDIGLPHSVNGSHAIE